MPLDLRPVTKENSETTLPQMLELIKGLAEYEKAPDAVEATVELLRESFGFGAQGGERYAQCVLAYNSAEDTEPVGMAVYFFTFSTWTGRGGLYLEDLFVKESARGAGVGKALFRYLGEVCKEKKLPRMDWFVLLTRRLQAGPSF